MTRLKKITSCNWVKGRPIHKLLNGISKTRFCSTKNNDVHATARDGFKQGTFYDQHRPSYTYGLMAHTVHSLFKGNTQGIKYNVLELGAGTGLFTRKVLPQMEKESTYLATEPPHEFLSVLKQQTPGLDTMEWPASNIPLPDQCVQNVICAQCFHWFANTESLQEISRVLVPKGRLIIVYNKKDRGHAWIKETDDILTDYYDDTPRYETDQWKCILEAFKSLEFVEHTELPGITIKQDDEVRQTARRRFEAVLDKHFPEVHEIQMPYISDFYCVEKV